MNEASGISWSREGSMSDGVIGIGGDGQHSIESYFAKQRVRAARYTGQLAPGFQASLAAHHAGVTPDDCDFYHTIETRDGRVHPGAWDLRDHEAAYLGRVDMAGKSVMEFGPASGWLSGAIAARAAHLTVFDLPFGGGPEFVPFPEVDMAQAARDAAISFSRLRNSWWFTKRELGFDARAVYGDIYELPSDLERCDISFFGAILLHLCSPFRALQQAASLTDETMIVTDVYSAPSIPALGSLMAVVPSLTVFNPSEPPAGLTHWWALSPELIQHMLRRLGFTDQSVTMHRPVRVDSQPPMFTVVGRRPASPSAAKPAAPASVARRSGPESREVPVPPPEMRFLVSGTEDEGIFIRLGTLGFNALASSLRSNGYDPALLDRVLDFGCGVGRVARHWASLHGVEVHGTDLSTEMVAWDQANLTFGTFAINTVEPKLGYADATFGLVYALSVFTHLPVEMQVTWMQELVRITKPGGLIYITTHGVRYIGLLTPNDADAFKRGEVVVTGGELPGSNHCAAFHPVAWVDRHFVADLDLDLLEHLPRGAQGNPEQDSWLLRRKM